MKSCKDCEFFNICDYADTCYDYDSSDELSDEYLDRIIEEGRYEYRKAWFEYTDEDYY